MHRTVTKAQKSADAIVTTTEWFASILRSRGMEKVYVVPNGAEECMFSAVEPIIPAQIPTGNLRVQYLGTVGRSQGLDTLVSALAHIKMQRPDLTISTRIIGEGAEVPRLKELSEKAQVNIDFCGTIARNKLAEAYSWTDVGLVSLRKTRPFRWTVPSKIYELLATRRHIVAAVEGSAAHIIHQSGVGTVVEPENPLALATALIRLADEPQRLRTGISGINLLRQKYSYTCMGRSYDRILREVLGVPSCEPLSNPQKFGSTKIDTRPLDALIGSEPVSSRLAS